MSEFLNKYFGHELAKQYGSQNARTNDMKPVGLDQHKKVFDRYRDNDLSALLADPRAPMRTIRRDTALSYSIDDLLTPAVRSSRQKSDAGRYGLPQSEQAYGAASASTLTDMNLGDATRNGYLGKLTTQPYQDTSYSS